MKITRATFPFSLQAMEKTIFDVKTYKDQLKTSAWMRKKYEILSRDNFVCQSCLKDNFESPLHVHHIAYDFTKKAWEYEDYMLVTLCEECHKFEHDSGNTKNGDIIQGWIKKLAAAKSPKQ